MGYITNLYEELMQKLIDYKFMKKSKVKHG